MIRALELATYAIKNCRPNPAVGAFVIKNGEILGEGYTQEIGKEHAEIIAIKNANKNHRSDEEKNTKGAELYVTLEPCSHYGRTPPCTETIINAGIKKVYYGILDINPLVAGKGIEKLKQAGIEVEQENLNGLIDKFYEPYNWFVKYKTPFITLKIAQTLDGFIANEDKTPLKITGEASQIELHRLRSFCDVVVVGGSTERLDKPKLNVRYVNGASPQKIIFSRNNFKRNSFEDSWNLMLESCIEKGMHFILVEAGAELAKNLFQIPNSFQKFLLWTGPLIIKNGFSWKHELNANSEVLKRLKLKQTYFQGDDFCEEFLFSSL